MTADPDRVFAAIDGTWPARRYIEDGPWMLRDGDGGGKRVSAATARGSVNAADIAAAETAMRAMGQTPLFSLRPHEAALGQSLAARGYAAVDPSIVHGIDPARLTDVPIPRVTVFAIWEPLAIMSEIWAAGGIGPARQRVMDRARGPKTALLGRQREMPGGAAFVAIHDGVAMVHALEILAHQRRQGMGAWMMRAAAFWAVENGAGTLSVICTAANAPANALYASLGFQPVGQYHYRQLKDDTP